MCRRSLAGFTCRRRMRTNVPEESDFIRVVRRSNLGSLASAMTIASQSVLTAITQPEICSTLQDLGFRAKVLSSSLVESASDGMIWKVELMPVPSATAVRFSADLAVAADPLESVNHFNLGRSLVVAACDQDFASDSAWRIEISMLRVFEGGVTSAHVAFWVESWVAGLEAAVATFFDLY